MPSVAKWWKKIPYYVNKFFQVNVVVGCIFFTFDECTQWDKNGKKCNLKCNFGQRTQCSKIGKDAISNVWLVSRLPQKVK